MTVIFKLGGSLMPLKGLAENLQVALEQRSTEACLIISGGGESADIVRKWSQIHELCDEAAHWLAISSIELNQLLLEKLLEFKSVSSRNTAGKFWFRERLPLLLNLKAFVAAEERSEAIQLPHNWHVTSDSLAAWTALRWPAEELILLKSVPAPVGMTVEEASRRGLVDGYFPVIAKHLHRISWCNLRGSKIIIEPWISRSVDLAEKADGVD